MPGQRPSSLGAEKVSNLLYLRDLQIARGMTAAAALIGCLDLIGWTFGLPLLTRIFPGFPTMKPLPGVCFILVSIALFLLDSRILKPESPGDSRRRIRIVVTVLGFAVLGVGLTAIVEDRTKPGYLDSLLFPREVVKVYGSESGRIPIATGIVFVSLALALWCIAWDPTGRRAWHQPLAGVSATISFLAILGYVYAAPFRHRFAPVEMMALNTAVGVFLLSCALYFVRPNVGVMETFNSSHFGGFLARRMLPLVLTLPFVLGWFRLRGEQLGYYGTEFGLAIFACSNTILFVTLVWWATRSLNLMDGQREEARAFEAERREILQAIAEGKPVPTILEQIVLLVERLAPEVRCSILLLERNTGTLSDGAGPSLPADYRRAIHGLEIGPEVGSCGTAAFRGKRVVVEDIETHPYWTRFRELARNHGLRACWSSPILAANGDVLGTFAVYSETPGRPHPKEFLWVDSATNLASIAIERRNAEEALRTSEAQLRFLFENAGLGMAMATIAGKLIKCNPALCALLGYSESEFLQLESAQLTFPDDLAADRQRFEALRTGKASTFQYMKRYIHKTGRVVYANLNVSVVKNEVGTPLYVVGIVEDITARRVAEAEKARVQAQVEQSQRLQALGTLAGGIAHDFNNILASIAGNVEFAWNAIGYNQPARPHLERISEAATRATGLVRQILAFSRLQTVERRSLRLHPIVEEALKLLRATLPAKIEIQTALETDVPEILADPTQVHQILMNLGTNAAQAMAEQGGILRVSLGMAKLTDKQINGLSAGTYVRLAVSDTGVGMDKTTLEHMFEPFFTTKAKGEGTGLGLSVVHGIVASYEGAIHATSAPGTGTQFDLYFPQAPPTPAAVAVRPLSARQGSGESILVIDDEKAVAEITQYRLEQNGYRAAVFTDSASALAAFTANPGSFDAVLTDLSMPGQSGLDVVRVIRELRPEIPVILTSGFFQNEDLEGATKLGVNDLLTKPYPTPKMLETLGKVLSNSEAEMPPAH